MSHELRTPLNSILILGQQLGDNPEQQPVTPKQVEFARTIHGAGTDLLNLISDILDLSKIESGTVTVEPAELVVRRPCSRASRGRSATRPRRAGLTFDVDSSTDASAAAIVTDPKRLQQVLKNLLSNAFKFTEQGGVRLEVAPAATGWSPTIRC